MADVNAQAPESSSAPQAVPTGSTEYAAWRMTGKTPAAAPAAKPKPEASAASSNETSGAGEKSAESTPASEPGEEQEAKPRSNAVTRLNELLADLKHAGLSPSELKTFKREAQQAAKPETESKPKEAPEQTAKPAEAPKKPKQEDFKTWEEFDAARDKYNEDYVAYQTQKAIGEYRAQQAGEKMQADLKAKLDDAKGRYGDEAQPTIVSSAKAIFNDAAVSPVITTMLNESTVLTDVLYTLGSKAEDLAEFVELAKSNPGAAIRKLALVEHLVKEELAKTGSGTKTPAKAAAPAEADGAETPGRDVTGKFTPAKKVSDAPPPPREAGGTAAPPADEVETAAHANDFSRFRSASNRRDLAKRKGN
jgi:hypothetical protein